MAFTFAISKIQHMTLSIIRYAVPNINIEYSIRGPQQPGNAASTFSEPKMERGSMQVYQTAPYSAFSQCSLQTEKSASEVHIKDVILSAKLNDVNFQVAKVETKKPQRRHRASTIERIAAGSEGLHNYQYPMDIEEAGSFTNTHNHKYNQVLTYKDSNACGTTAISAVNTRGISILSSSSAIRSMDNKRLARLTGTNLVRNASIEEHLAYLREQIMSWPRRPPSNWEQSIQWLRRAPPQKLHELEVDCRGLVRGKNKAKAHQDKIELYWEHSNDKAINLLICWLTFGTMDEKPSFPLYYQPSQWVNNPGDH